MLVHIISYLINAHIDAALIHINTEYSHRINMNVVEVVAKPLAY